MRPQHFARLKAIALRWSRRHADADDIVQDALIEAVRQNRTDLSEPRNMRWISGVVRNRARMTARTATRRLHRDNAWHREQAPASASAEELSDLLDGLAPSLRIVAVLALNGMTRSEIAWLLNLTDTALRQRITGLRRHFRKLGAAMPDTLPGLTLDLPYGTIRESLLPQLRRASGVFGAHDPDGHLFVVTRSQNAQ